MKAAQAYSANFLNLLQPGFVLPEQLLPSRTTKSLHRLLLCILEQALSDLTIPDHEPADEDLRLRARRWFQQPETGQFTFRQVCEYLGFEESYILRLIAAPRPERKRHTRKFFCNPTKIGSKPRAWYKTALAS
jgi:hypothetical protein